MPEEVYTRQLLGEIERFAQEFCERSANQHSYQTLAAFVESFVCSHTAKPLSAGGLFQRDPSDIHRAAKGRGYADNFPNATNAAELLDPLAIRHLRLLLEHIPAFVYAPKTTSQRKDRIEQLRKFCEDYLELRGLFPAGQDQVIANEEWSAPMTKTEMARRITGKRKARPREVAAFLNQHGLRHVAGRKFIVRLDNMDANNRRKLEEPE